MDISLVPFWNKKDLQPPAVNCLKITSDSPEKISASIAEILEDIISCLSDQDLLHCDGALASRFLFRTKRLLRNNKGYKCFQKVRHCLSNYLSLDLLSTVTEIRHTSYGVHGPNKEALEWCLVSLQRFTALFHRLQGTCFEAANCMYSHITSGNTWNLAILFLASLSRIWTLSRYLTCLACEWYLKLKPFLINLQTSQQQWLPDGYEFPKDLKSWLGNPDYLTPQNKQQNEVTETIETDKTKVQQSNLKGLVFNEDIGELISRKVRSSTACIKERNVIFDKCEDIGAFLKREQYFRQSNSEDSKTKHLSEAEWKYLRSYLRTSFIQLKSVKDQRIYYESMRRAQEKLDSWLKK